MFKGKRAWLPDESRKLVMKISLFEQISLFDEMKIDRLCLVKKNHVFTVLFSSWLQGCSLPRKSST